jgi:2-dehydropantoate 2-reductase
MCLCQCRVCASNLGAVTTPTETDQPDMVKLKKRQIRIAVVGPGAIGAAIAAQLHKVGNPVLLCGRTPRARLEVRPDYGDPVIVPGPVHTDPDSTGTVDVVFLAVKATQLDDASRWLTALCDHNTEVCVLQNGVEQIERVQPRCPSSRVVPAIVWFPSETNADGSVRPRAKPEVMLPDSAGIVGDVLRGAGCIVELTDDFATEAWRKLVLNAVGGLMALTGRRTAMFCRDDIATMTRDYVAECLAVARAQGAQLGDEVVAEIIDWYRKYPADITSSMRTDRKADRPLEWDIINGVVLRKARAHGVPAPISEVVVPLLAAASDGPG